MREYIDADAVILSLYECKVVCHFSLYAYGMAVFFSLFRTFGVCANVEKESFSMSHSQSDLDIVFLQQQIPFFLVQNKNQTQQKYIYTHTQQSFSCFFLFNPPQNHIKIDLNE